MEHGGDADARAEMPRIGSDGEHGLRCCPEQQVVNDRLVLQGDVGDLGRNGEDDVEVADWQQIGLARSQPFARLRPLALGAMPIAAAIIGDALVAAVFAAFDVAALRGGAARLDGRHDFELGQTDMTRMGHPPRRSMAAQDVGELQYGAHRRLSRWGPSSPRSAPRPYRADWSRCGPFWLPLACTAPCSRAWRVQAATRHNTHPSMLLKFQELLLRIWCYRPFRPLAGTESRNFVSLDDPGRSFAWLPSFDVATP